MHYYTTVIFCVDAVKPEYGYDDHTTPEWSDPNQPLFM